MDYSSWINTSLDLNMNPLRPINEAPVTKKEVGSNFLQLGREPCVNKQEADHDVLMEELNRVSVENKKLSEMLTEMRENYNALRNHLMDYMKRNPEKEVTLSKKRKSESSNTNDNGKSSSPVINGNSESSSTEEQSSKKPNGESTKAKTSRLYVRAEASDTSLVVKDGYQWRKYGQKVTRDNPTPRAYFKCSFAPSCPVKKKVQRSLEDQCILVAIYEGEHNHPKTSQLEATSGSRRSLALGSMPGIASFSLAETTVPLDLTKTKSTNDAKNSIAKIQSPKMQQFLVEQMASALTKDPNFTAALAAAISGNVLQKNLTNKW